MENSSFIIPRSSFQEPSPDVLSQTDVKQLTIFKAHLAELNSGSSERWGSLTSETLTWESREEKRILHLEDVVGAAIAPNLPDNSPGFVVSAYPLARSGIFRQRQRVLREYQFICPDDRTRDRWVRAINNILRGVGDVEATLPPRRLHVLLNPASGNRNPRQIFDRISPLLAASPIQWTLTETQGGGDAARIARNLPLNAIDGLVVVGGDGTIHEAINGLMSRSDWEKAIEIPIGTIPAGTGNGLCKTVLEMVGEPDDALSAAFLIAKGEVRSFDAIRVRQQHRCYYSILSLAWGLVSDVDIESERLRWLGSLRSDLYALLRILKLRTYRGRFSFVRPSPSSLAKRAKHSDILDVVQPTIDRSNALPLQCPSSSPSPDREWQTIEDEFVLVWALNLPWAERAMKAAPNVRPDEGAMDVLVVRRGISKWQLLRALLQIADGSHTQVPGMEFYKVGKFRLEPAKSQGILAVDGEKVENSTVEMEVLNGWIRVFCAGSKLRGN